MLVKFNATRLMVFKDSKIIPGINDLPDELVSDLQDHPIHAGKFDNGTLEVIGKEDIGAKTIKTKNGKPPTGVDMLLAASDKNAIAIAGQTVDMTILKVWYKKEPRPKVKDAIKAQAAKIKNIKFRTAEDKVKYEKKDGE